MARRGTDVHAASVRTANGGPSEQNLSVTVGPQREQYPFAVASVIRQPQLDLNLTTD
jgi:hypothetical protein